MTQQELVFDGPFLTKIDITRLTTQFARVFVVMYDGKWRTLEEIKEAIGTGSEAGISARLRDFRKKKHGSHEVKSQRRDAATGLWEYRLIVNPAADMDWILDMAKAA